MVRRLEPDAIAVGDSLILCSNQTTERARLGHLPTMRKSKILLFLECNNHRTVFLWVHSENLLSEFNPLHSGCRCTSGNIASSFLRWAYKDPDLPIAFRQKKKCGCNLGLAMSKRNLCAFFLTI